MDFVVFNGFSWMVIVYIWCTIVIYVKLSFKCIEFITGVYLYPAPLKLPPNPPNTPLLILLSVLTHMATYDCM